MKHFLHIILAVSAAIPLLVGCEVRVHSHSHVELSWPVNTNIESSKPFISDTGIAMIPKDADNPQITMYGTVVKTVTKQSVSGVQVRIVGTDTPGGSTMTNDDGSWILALPIVPDRNDENTTLFAIELRKEGAVTDFDTSILSRPCSMGVTARGRSEYL